jgi:hypothetical protein
MNAKESRNFVDSIKLESGCIKCGYKKNPKALEFNHIDPATKYRDRNGKSVDIARMALASGKNSAEKSRYSIKTILLEISKCEILCANCHREHTFPDSNVFSDDDLMSDGQNQI